MKQLRNGVLLLLLAVLAAIGCGQALVEFPLGTPPVVVSTSPADAATGVPLDSSIRATFSAPMGPATITGETFSLTQGGNPVSATVAYADGTAILTPANALATGSTFIATIKAGITDVDGNAMLDDYVWNFATGPTDVTDTKPPTVTFTMPADQAEGVAAGATVHAAFSEALDPKTINASTFTLRQGAALLSATVVYTDTTAILTPDSPLEVGATLTTTITTGITDLAGNAMVDDYVWSFETSPTVVTDTTPPTVTFTDPKDLAEGVVADAKIHAAFSEALDPATIDASTFTLHQGATLLPATVIYTDTTAVLTPNSPLPAGAVMTATITTGITDIAGNAMVDDYVWSFTTSLTPDTTAPTVLSTNPANGAIGVAIDSAITATFSEVMDAATISNATFELAQGAMSVSGSVTYAGTTATFTPTNDLLPATPYTATITTGVLDLAGNALAADYTWTFATGAPPEVLSTNPMNGAFGVAIDREVEATFNVAMDPTTIDDTSFMLKHGAVPLPGTVTYAGMTATFVPLNDYPMNAILTATITTAAKDMAGNALLDDYVWSFQTGSKKAQNGIPLGLASTFAILAFNTVTNVNNPGTIVTGDLGISPGAALVGFPPGVIIGATHAGDAVAAMAKVDLLTAYNDAAGRLGAAVLPGDLSGLTFYPGLYKNSTSVMLSTGNFTLDAQGDVNAVFIFQMGSTFTSSPATQMVLAGGAKATNIYWSVGTSATLGTNTIFKGTIMAGSAITMNTGGTIEGRLLALGAAIALDTNAITVPSP